MEMSQHLLHGIRIDLAHVFPLVHVLDLRDSQVPRAFTIRVDGEARIGRYQLAIHRNEHMSIDVHPCHLER